MNSSMDEVDVPRLTVADIYYTLFRHKWKIIACSIGGLVVAFLIHRLAPRTYESEAKLLIRYVTDTKSPAIDAGGATAKSPDQRGETIMDSEMEIISSFDLARKVAEAIGPEKILGPDIAKLTPPNDLQQAALVIKDSLKLEIPARSSVIRLILKHPERDLVQPALEELVESYLKLHLEFHRAGSVAETFLARETDQFRARLYHTESELRKARKKTGVPPLEGNGKTPELIASIRQQIYAAQAELAERTALLEHDAKRRSATPQSATSSPQEETEVPADVISEYESVASRLDHFRKVEQALLTEFRDENSRVRDARAQRLKEEANKRTLETRYPALVRRGITPHSRISAIPEAKANDKEQQESERIFALKAKIGVLQSQLDELRAEANAVNQAEPQLTELQRKKELEEANYRHFSSSLEQARIAEALAAGATSNITLIQKPSPPVLDQKGAKKFIVLAGLGGIGMGIAWAFVLELYLDRSIRRRSDVERLVQPALFLSIPVLNRKRIAGSSTALQPYSPGDAKESPALEQYHEALRNQIIGYFEGKGLVRKPKLIAVTGINSRSGVSTVAAGLARSLSETGEGNVLLVDMTLGQESARHFVNGKIQCDLDQVLEIPDPAQVAGHLYVVSETTQQDRFPSNLPQRFSKLAPKLKASAFEYIIFDLPPISPISITARLAVFMDLVVMTVRSEKTGDGMFARATALLTQANVPVGIVLNRTRAYVPGWLQQDFIGDN